MHTCQFFNCIFGHWCYSGNTVINNNASFNIACAGKGFNWPLSRKPDRKGKTAVKQGGELRLEEIIEQAKRVAVLVCIFLHLIYISYIVVLKSVWKDSTWIKRLT